jgi:hypothetical protein
MSSPVKRSSTEKSKAGNGTGGPPEQPAVIMRIKNNSIKRLFFGRKHAICQFLFLHFIQPYDPSYEKTEKSARHIMHISHGGGELHFAKIEDGKEDPTYQSEDCPDNYHSCHEFLLITPYLSL